MDQRRQEAVDNLRDERSYWLFLSYAHADQGEARRWHRQLERYSVPVSLRGRETGFGPAPERFTPIFRDRDELTAAPNLPDRIRDAIIRSRYLLLLATPDAAASTWVREEVDAFVGQHGIERVIIVIAAGHPGKVGTADDPIPPSLRSAFDDGVLVAADARPEADGASRTKLKVIARLLDLDTIDVLAQRDAHATRRRLRALQASCATFAAVAVVAVASFVTADRRGRAIEEAVGVSLAEIATTMDDVTRRREAGTLTTEAAQEEIETALRLARTPLAILSGDARVAAAEFGIRRAAVEQFLATGRTDRAVDEVERLVTLVEQVPEGAARRVADAEAAYWHGRTLEQQGRVEDAERTWRAALERAEVIEPTATNEPVAWMAFWIRSALAGLARRRGDAAEATRGYEEALGLGEQLVELRPFDLRYRRATAQLANVMASQASRRGESDRAIAVYQRNLEVLRGMIALQPDSLRFRSDLWATLTLLAYEEEGASEPKTALQTHEEALTQARALTAADPGNVDYQRNVAISLNGVAYNRLRVGDTQTLVTYDELLEQIRRLLEGNPSDPNLQRDLGLALNEVSRLNRNEGQLEEAQYAVAESLAIARGLAAADDESLTYANDVRFALLEQAAVWSALDDATMAQGAVDEARGIAVRLETAAPDDEGFRLDAATTDCTAGDIEHAAGDFERASSLARAGLERLGVEVDQGLDDAVGGDLRRQAARCFSTLANALEGVGEAERAAVARQRGQEVLKPLMLSELDARDQALWAALTGAPSLP